MSDKAITFIAVLSKRDFPRSPQSGKSAYLVQIYPADSSLGQRIPVADQLVIGRSTECDIVLDFNTVSRRHAQILLNQEKSEIEDLGSTNGTYVNELLVQKCILSDGDRLQIGGIVFKFLTGENLEATYHEAVYSAMVTDGLTGLYNRRHLLELLRRETEICVRFSRPIALAIIDIDYLERINKEHGQIAGNQVLRVVAERLRQVFNNNENIGRLDGGRFAIIFPGSDAAAALGLTSRASTLVAAEPITFKDNRISITLSGGLAVLDPGTPAQEAERFIDDAIISMDGAKKSGRNQVAGPIPRAITAPSDLAKHSKSILTDALFRREMESSCKSDRDVSSTRLIRAVPVSCLLGVRLDGRATIRAHHGGSTLEILETVLKASVSSHIQSTEIIGEFDDGILIAGLTRNLPEGVELSFIVQQTFTEISTQRAPSVHAKAIASVTAVEKDEDVSANIARAVAGIEEEARIAATQTSLPLPIEMALRAARSQAAPTTKAFAVFSLIEVSVRYMFSLAAAMLQALPPKEGRGRVIMRLVDALRKPVTLGVWVELLRSVLHYLIAFSPDQLQVPAILNALLKSNGKPTEDLRFIEELVGRRNAFVHGDKAADETESRLFVDCYFPRIEAMLRRLAQLAETPVIVVTDIDIVERNNGVSYRYAIRRFTGDNPILPLLQIETTSALRRSQPFAYREGGASLPCEPFLVVSPPTRIGWRIGFLDGIRESSFLYKDLLSGEPIDLPATTLERVARSFETLCKTDEKVEEAT